MSYRICILAADVDPVDGLFSYTFIMLIKTYAIYICKKSI